MPTWWARAGRRPFDGLYQDLPGGGHAILARRNKYRHGSRPAASSAAALGSGTAVTDNVAKGEAASAGITGANDAELPIVKFVLSRMALGSIATSVPAATNVPPL